MGKTKTSSSSSPRLAASTLATTPAAAAEGQAMKSPTLVAATTTEATITSESPYFIRSPFGLGLDIVLSSKVMASASTVAVKEAAPFSSFFSFALF